MTNLTLLNIFLKKNSRNSVNWYDVHKTLIIKHIKYFDFRMSDVITLLSLLTYYYLSVHGLSSENT